MLPECAAGEPAPRTYNFAYLDENTKRMLRRATLKEQEQQKPPRNYRALFQALKSLETDAADAASGDESTPDTGAA